MTTRPPAATMPEGNRLQSTAIGMARLEVAPPRRGAHDSLSSRSKPLRSLRQPLCVLCVFILRFPCAFLALGERTIFSIVGKRAKIFSNHWKGKGTDPLNHALPRAETGENRSLLAAWKAAHRSVQ